MIRDLAAALDSVAAVAEMEIEQTYDICHAELLERISLKGSLGWWIPTGWRQGRCSAWRAAFARD